MKWDERLSTLRERVLSKIIPFVLVLLSACNGLAPTYGKTHRGALKLPQTSSNNVGAYSLVLIKDRAFVAVDDGLAVVDVSTPLSPKLVTTLVVTHGNLGNWPQSVVARLDDHTVVSSDRHFLTVYDVSNPDAPAKIGELALANEYGRAIGVRGTTVVVAESNMGIELVDLSVRSAPKSVSRYDNADHTFQSNVRVFGDRAYVPAIKAVDIVDLTNPSAPTKLGSISVPNVVDTYAVGDELFLSRGQTSNGASHHLWNVKDPAHPTESAKINGTGTTSAGPICGYERNLFVVPYGYFGLVDQYAVDEPGKLRFLDASFGDELLPGSQCAFDGKYMFIPASNGFLVIELEKK